MLVFEFIIPVYFAARHKATPRLGELSDEAFHQEVILVEQLKAQTAHIAPTLFKKKPKIKKPPKGHGPTEQTRLEHVEEVFL